MAEGRVGERILPSMPRNCKLSIVYSNSLIRLYLLLICTHDMQKFELFITTRDN